LPTYAGNEEYFGDKLAYMDGIFVEMRDGKQSKWLNIDDQLLKNRRMER
jgi:hypothetical protein